MVFGFRKSKTKDEPVVDRSSTSSGDALDEKDAARSTAVDDGTRRKSSLAQAEELATFDRDHQWDPNLPEYKREEIHRAVKKDDEAAEVVLDSELLEDSPYPEVRSVVRNYDEDVPANTIRAWVLGLIFSTLGSGLNMLFSLRAPSIVLTAIVAQLVSYPFGVLWEKTLPNKQFNLFGLKFNLNPGKFNKKEHVIIVVMANASFAGGAAYGTDILLAQQVFYKQDFGWGFGILLTVTIQCMGYGLAGLCRRFLVWPASMIWPTNLPNVALFYSLHDDHQKNDPALTNGWTISRYRYYLYVFLGAFVWYWFPGWIFQALSVFAFVTFIRPNNVVINQVFGGWTGVSLFPITFDWTQIAGYVGSPLIPPWFALANTLAGCVLFYVITCLGIHYTGKFYSAYLPISDSNSYDNTGNTYNVSRVLTPNFELDPAKYEAYSPLFLSTTFTMSYGLSFATIAAVITHTICFHGREVVSRFRRSRGEEPDVHMRMYTKYPDAPDWWYISLFLVMFGISMGITQGYDTHLAWWAFIISLIIAAVWIIPTGIIQAVTNIQIGLNVITEFIIGYMQPGKPVAMMIFKAYGYITQYQALAFLADLKLGVYMKVPPRTLFMTQLVASIWSGIVQVAVLRWATGGGIKNVCDRKLAPNHFTCPGGRVFFNASVIWGLLGPGRIFSVGQIYSNVLWFFLVGFFTPIIIWLVAKRFPRSGARYFIAPVFFGGAGLIPPATPLNYLSWGIVGFIFNKYIRNKYRGWWSAYNYLTSAALDSGLAICTILIFLALVLSQAKAPDWWGNNVINTMDFEDTAIQKVVADGEIFGPKSWS